MYTQKQSPFWWTRNLTSTMYFLRELTGPIIAAFMLYLFVGGMFFPDVSFFSRGIFYNLFQKVAFTAAVFHTLTWFWVTVKLSPIPLKKALQLTAFILALVGCFAASYLLYTYFYETYPNDLLF